MLLVHDERGFVNQVVMVGDFEKLKPLYTANGQSWVEAEFVDNPGKVWINNGVVTDMPEVDVSGPARPFRPIDADGIDALVFDVAPASFELTVLLNGTVVHKESSDGGTVEFATDHPGTYVLVFSAAFPHLPTTVTVEAK